MMDLDRSFQEKVNRALSEIGDEKLSFRTAEEYRYKETYDHIMQYAIEHHLFYTAVALPVVRALHDGAYRGWIMQQDGSQCPMPYINHCLAVCRMLIDLHVPLEDGEEDILLSCALCHDLIGHVLGEERADEITAVYHLDPVILDTLKLLAGRDYAEDTRHAEVFEKIWLKGNKIALLVKLTDCSCIIEQLYNAPMRVAKEYIYQTRMQYLPMCIRTKERYPELSGVAGILMEKMRSLSDVIEILVSRYETREVELNNELLQLRDENVSIRREVEQKKMMHAYITAEVHT